MGNRDIGGKKKESRKKGGKVEEKPTTITTAQKTKPEPSVTTKSTNTHASKVIRCDCTHAFQDRVYGVGMRVHTPKRAGGWRCTVCRKEH